MADTPPLTRSQMVHLACNGVQKVNRMGKRGTTLVSMAEIEAMAALIVYSGALLTPEVVELAKAELAQRAENQITDGNQEETP